jgi:predicted nucleic acid-binding protein
MLQGLTTKQLELLMKTAKPLPVEKRDAFLRRVAAHLQKDYRGQRITDGIIANVAERAAIGLHQNLKPAKNKMDITCAGKAGSVWRGLR